MGTATEAGAMRAATALLAATILVAGVGAGVGGAAPAAANPSIPGSSTGPGGSIWIPNYGADTVLEVDAATMTQKREVRVGAEDHPMVAKASYDGSKIFVGNFGPIEMSVTVIDAATGRIIKKLPTLLAAYATITMSRDGRRLYVPTAASVVQVFDTQTLELVRTVPIWLPPGIAHIEVSNDEKYIYAYAAMGTATRYDAQTGAVAGAPLLLGGLVPGWGASSADGGTQYAINFYSNVAIIDSASWTVRATVPIEPFAAGPISATLSPDGRELWVCNYSTNDIRILDAQTGKEKRRMSTPGAAVYVGFSRDGNTGYISVVEDGPPLPFWAPTVWDWQYKAKHQAWSAKYLGLNTRLVKIDTRTLETRGEFTVKGAFVAGAYPD
ncbi:YncE family protein [Tsukamurella strandjordii]|uniref:YncE family protein n=1 Tax=Tsukamurella strandjordii TaxID=147577 RepID=UPI0031DA7C5B